MKALFFLSAALALVAPATAAITFTAVGVYNEQTVNLNTVDSSALALTDTVFGADVAAAFANHTGGVVNFDDFADAATVIRNGNWTVNYGGSSSLGVTVSGGQLNMNTTDVNTIKATPISGSSYYRLGGTTTSLAFSAPLSEFGFTILARNADRTLNSIVVTYSDNSTATITSGAINLTLNTAASATSPASGNDRFFGYKDTTGKGITAIAINGGDNLVFDDFGFIASAVPEPSVTLLGAGGLALLIARRRRA